jgi:putative ABC transport system permease protein
MNERWLLVRNLGYHFRTNLPVLLGCIVCSSVLTGALLVGDSMRGSLRAMTLERLGAIDSVSVSSQFFPIDLASRMEAATGGKANVVPALLVKGTVVNPNADDASKSGHAYKVNLIGTTAGFWKFFPPIGNTTQQEFQHRHVAVNASLAERLGASAGQTVQAFVERASALPRETVLGERRETQRPLSLKIDDVIPDRHAGRFSLEASQKTPLDLFMPLDDLARMLEQPGRANALLVAGTSNEAGNAAFENFSFKLEDFGASFVKGSNCYWLEHHRLTLNEPLAKKASEVAEKLGLKATPVLTTLATDIRLGAKSVPYSIVAAVDDLSPILSKAPAGSAIVNDWTVKELSAKIGDRIAVEYFESQRDGSLMVNRANFTIVGTAPIADWADDSHFAPSLPGVTDVDDFRNWKVPFEVDRRRIRKQDDDYWHRYKTTPKVFVKLEDGRKFWSNRFGDTTSLRVSLPTGRNDATLDEQIKTMSTDLAAALDPATQGFHFDSIRQRQLEASSGATPFDVLFLSFSFFLIASAAAIVALMFRLNTERRAKEVGLLLAVGATPAKARRVLLGEGLLLATLGSLIGLLGAVIYAKLMIRGLTSRWREAVNAPFIDFYATPTSLVIGFLASIALAAVAIWWSIRRLAKSPAPKLLAPGFTFGDDQIRTPSRWRMWAALALLIVGIAVPMVGGRDNIGAFFGGGAALLAAALLAFSHLLARPTTGLVRGSGWGAAIRLGVGNARRQRTRSVLTVCLLAFASFIVVSVSAFRHGEDDRPPQKNSGDGGFALAAESASPLFAPPDAAHEADLPLAEPTLQLLKGCDVHALRMRAGDDASCLNIYQPQSPTLLGVDGNFRRRDGFAFSKTLKDATEEEKKNPWTLLERRFDDGAVATIGDAEAMEYILKVSVGGDIVVKDDAGRPVTLRFVAAVSSSILQSQLLIAEESMLDRFPETAGFRYFLFDAGKLSREQQRDLGAKLELDLSDYGFEVRSTAAILAAYRAVANTYIAAFQTLGGLGLLLGTLGLAAVVLRNVFERRGELALLRAVGFQGSSVTAIVLAENALLLLVGVGVGAICSVVAVAPHFLDARERPALASLIAMLGLVLAVGLGVGAWAARTALREPIIPALRAE